MLISTNKTRFPDLAVNKTKVFFPNLDALRFFAFFFVYLSHTNIGDLLIANIENGLIRAIIKFIFHNGELGVSVFFVLSGFLITYLIITEINNNGRLDIKAFYIRRTLRIWPLYFLVLIFGFELYPFLKELLGIHSDLCSRPLFYYLFLSNFDLIHIRQLCPGNEAMINGITWSVAIEEQFYLIWPIFFIFISKRIFPYLFIILLVLGFIFRFNNLSDNHILYYHTLSVFGDLIIGAFAAYLVIFSKKFKLFFEKLKLKAIIFIYIIGFIICIFGHLLNYLDLFKLFYRFLTSSFFAYIILEQNFNANSSIKLGKLKLNSIARKYTYGYYLLHPISILIVDVISRIIKFDVSGWFGILGSATVALLITFVISYISYHYFEIHFIKFKDRFSYVIKK